MAHLCVGVAALCAWPAQPARLVGTRQTAAARPAVSTGDVDAALRRAALSALGGRDGAVVVLDAQTGRVRAASNPRLADGEEFPPGSAVKPFTLLAALRNGLARPDSRLLCRRHFRRADADFTCAHPVFKPPFDAEQALAHSCNFYFARLGERLDAQLFKQTLAAHGLLAQPAAPRADSSATRRTKSRTTQHAAAQPPGRAAARATTHHADSRAAAPRVAPARWDTSTALGEGGALVVTPLRLVAAYAALFNGGRLYEARAADAESFHARELSRVHVSDEERALLIAGMRGAVRYGTAEAAELDELPLPVFGKTGTATELGGFRTHGWFVGFAADGAGDSRLTTPDWHSTSDDERRTTSDEGRGRTPGDGRETAPEQASRDAFLHERLAPPRIRLAVVVFLKRGQGKQAAAVAREIFAEYARLVPAGAREGSEPVPSGETDETTTRPHESQPSAQESQSSLSESPPSPQSQSSSPGSQSSARAFRPEGRGRDEVSPTVRVRAARDGAALALPLEDYLFGVLAAEASTEDEFAALKAQAVVSRTYALRHLGRHAREGFDFCSTTHCQRYLGVTKANARPDFHSMLRDALSETAGETLRDARGRTAAAYFSASCGGMTANVETLWGERASEAYERGVRDEACAATRYSRWADRIPARQLLAALREDPRTDVGSHLSGVRVVRRDRTGRAELVEVAGDRRLTLRGWDFKIIVGRTLGWSVVKSSRFEVARAGSEFVFRGSGFGHGLGLCQLGAHVLARRGADYRQILAHYFPGASVARRGEAASHDGGAAARGGDTARHDGGAAAGADGPHAVSTSIWMPDASAPLHVPPARARRASTRASRPTLTPSIPSAPPTTYAPRFKLATYAPRLTLSSENFRASYPARSAANARREVEAALATLEAARADLLGRLAAASLAPPALRRVEVNFNETTADFVAATGQPAWAAGATRGARVELQPLALLGRRGVVRETLRHELAHAFIEALSRGRAPRWLAEGLAAHFAGEGALLSRHAPRARVPVEELERKLTAPASAAETRALYAAAHREVVSLIRAEGEPAAWRRAALR